MKPLHSRHLPSWFYTEWKDFSYRANRHFGVWEESDRSRRYAGTIDHWLLVIIVSGHVTIHKGIRECSMKTHDAVILTPEHRGYRQTNHAKGNLVCRFPIELISPNEPRNPLVGLPDLVPIRYPDPRRLEEIMTMLKGFGRTPRTDAGCMQGTAWLHELLTTCILEGFRSQRYPSEPLDTAGWVRDARAFIQQRHKDPDLSVVDISRKVGKAPRTLQQAFREAYGTTPLSYLHQMRILTAKRLIASNPEFTIQYLMSRVGYRSRSLFHRMFVRYAGATPSTFR